MRLASETSSTAVRSGTLPISPKYMRTGSLVGDLTERSSFGAASGSPVGSLSAAGPSPSMMSMPRSTRTPWISSTCSAVRSTSCSAAASCAPVTYPCSCPSSIRPLTSSAHSAASSGDAARSSDGSSTWRPPALRGEVRPREWPLRLRGTTAAGHYGCGDGTPRTRCPVAVARKRVPVDGPGAVDDARQAVCRYEHYKSRGASGRRAAAGPYAIESQPRDPTPRRERGSAARPSEGDERELISARTAYHELLRLGAR